MVNHEVLHRLGRKVLDAKAKHRWLTACARFRGFVDSPGVLRLAILLFEFFNSAYGFAYPSRRTLADRFGVSAGEREQMDARPQDFQRRQGGEGRRRAG